MDRLRRWVAVLPLVIGLLAAAGCEDTTASPEQRAQLEAAVAGYNTGRRYLDALDAVLTAQIASTVLDLNDATGKRRLRFGARSL